MVAALRICGEPTVRAACASAGTSAASGGRSSSAYVTAAPRRNVPAAGSWTQPRSSGSRRTDSTVRSSATASRDSLTSTITSVPPASTIAVGTSTSAASASSSDVGVSTDTGRKCTNALGTRPDHVIGGFAEGLPLSKPSDAGNPRMGVYGTTTPERSSSGSGYCGSMALKWWRRILATARLRTHLRSPGTTYHGASPVEVRSSASW